MNGPSGDGSPEQCANAKEGESGDQEMDPLDEFMMEINKVLEEEKQKTESREKDAEEAAKSAPQKGSNFTRTEKEPLRGNTPKCVGNYFVRETKSHVERKSNHTLDNHTEEDGGHDDDSLDDNDATADIYEFLEKKNEELASEKRRLEAHAGKGTHDRNMMSDDSPDDGDGFFQNGRESNKENEIIENDINYDEVHLDHFNKDIFVTDNSITDFTLEESVEYKKKNNITTIGFSVPKPLFSFLQLKNVIDKEVLENMYNLSISILSPIQSIVIPIFLSGRDFIASSRTGSGKTLSFIISLIIHLVNYKKIEKEKKGKNFHKESDPPEEEHTVTSPPGAIPTSLPSKQGKGNASSHALILTPTRELCVQIYDQINKLCLNKLKSCILFNGINYKNAYDDIHKGVDIIIANVKTLINFVNKTYLSLTKIKYVILDEFDRLFSKQFVHSVTSILRNIRPDAMKGFFSSTFSEQSCELAKPYLNKKFIIIKVGENNILIDKKFYILEDHAKYDCLLNCVHACAPSGQGFIFCNSKKNVMTLYEKLKREISLRHISFDYIYGDIDQTERLYKLDCLKKKKTQVMISTDLMARGIDIIDLNFVINYDCPNDIFVYVHRIGRCSRMNNRGQAITFIQPSEKRIAFLIYSHLNNKKEKVDQTLEDFIRRNNLHNDVQMKKVKRKMNDSIFDVSQKKAKHPGDNKSILADFAFKKMSAPSRSGEDALKNLKVFTPNDVLTSSDEDY
ncbi:ATP-dependent RNA helicase, putative [Plasmodium knowlesi strain H]|uniref:ATP-dependent RNA helicase, putative n=3 Tax=Plasmodium knowlesi TaxID=5850 RepID=A0A5K1U3G4_PLAKH|nr:ATP-dependent RNA helicase DDX42, putative [Plasmodium knowlesi strain H]OTN65770.1 putative ATP-dependent RNA helicase [Plasmodium knowlesi]CAA9987835.1 ATP-dependent RNA helicase DDX42, putative [Plasmodium knowlesi strain H]SBO22348.1 ATP-dependent RNA helicase, putative [Plasmodium knowlesi strain H]SBO28768.1 ATP-dependent RNA helicase, putative [Plasmodium knowlesi strain H]VVS77309.1 ATP-dependent RNA helicase DDX42, putative [Plasmodium knowlesi strain H]|eukprot:XP_002258833.1 ATP-dependent RNA helicase, putative [Plasmodium knowlesi strain H]